MPDDPRTELLYTPDDLLGYARALRAKARAWLQDQSHNEPEKKLLHDATQQDADFIESIAKRAIEERVIVCYPYPDRHV
jgi:hypothetical protein